MVLANRSFVHYFLSGNKVIITKAVIKNQAHQGTTSNISIAESNPFKTEPINIKVINAKII